MRVSMMFLRTILNRSKSRTSGSFDTSDSSRLVVNELVGPHKAKLWFDLTKVLPACFGLCEELLAQAFWVPILVALSHFHYIQ
jgi:hypothetical protein